MADENGLNMFEERIRESSAYFTSLVELIPAKLYALDSNDNDFHAKRKKKLPQSGKAARDLRKQLAKRAKYLKLDPGHHKTIKEIQEMIEEREKALLEDSSESEEDTKIKTAKNIRVKPETQSEIRAKLQSKLSTFRAQRNNKTGRNKEVQSTVGVKLSKKEKRKAKLREKQKEVVRKEAVMMPSATNNENTKDSNLKEDIMFSNLDFGGKHGNSKKRKQSDKRLLQRAIAKKQKVEKIEEEDQGKAAEIKSSDMWKRALKHAEGVKVKDDPKLLKRSIKRKEKQKEKSAKKWKERTDQQKKQMEEKQKLRKEHLKERNSNKKKKRK